jgi:cytidyltransferase-like protein
LKNNIKSKKVNYKQGIVFGVFDGLHLGHQYFLDEVFKKCDQLIVVVTQNQIVELLKNRSPKNSLEERILKIKEFNNQFVVLAGDLVLGKWSVFKEYSPEVVFLGYDQQAIFKELDKIGINYVFIDSYFPEKYKSSLI